MVKLESGATTVAVKHFCKEAAGKVHSDSAAPDGHVDSTPLRVLAAMKSLPSHRGAVPICCQPGY